MDSTTATTTEGRHRDVSPEARERCERMESSTLMVRLHDGVYDPRHSADFPREVAA